MTSEAAALHALLPDDFDVAHFLRHYWQQKPLLIRGRRFADPISPEALAGLACEDFIDARLVRCQHSPARWQLEHGPFEETTFASLPQQDYSLLVQAVDGWHPGVRQLARNFSFLPGWRRDDIMVSYATSGGNVGPHFDQYDVFLIQGLGRKRWLVGDACDSDTPVDNSSGLCLLREFRAQQEFLVTAGDILYLPPGIAHHGIAETPAITYSVGFRAPSASEVISELGPLLAQHLPEQLRYRDSGEPLATNMAQIPATVSASLSDLFTLGSKYMLAQQALIQRWFGEYMTAPRHPDLIDAQADSNVMHDATDIVGAGALVRNPLSRLAFSKNEDTLQLFADGQCLDCLPQARDLVLQLCDDKLPPQHGFSSSNTDDAALLLQLFAQGSLMPRQDLPDDFLAAAD